MRRSGLAAVLLSGLVTLAACGQPSGGTADSDTPAAQQGGVAVIDLDDVARQLGRDTVIKDSLQAREASLNKQLAVLQTSYQNQVNEKKRELGEGVGEAEQQQIAALERQATVQLQQVRQQAQNDLNQHRGEVINAFRDEVKPHATQVAAERGLSIVIPKNEVFLFAFDPAVDITADVVKKMRSLPAPAPVATPTSTAPAAPANSSSLQEPGFLPPGNSEPIEGR